MLNKMKILHISLILGIFTVMTVATCRMGDPPFSMVKSLKGLLS